MSDIGSDPAAYTGTITVTGIMGGCFPAGPEHLRHHGCQGAAVQDANCNKVFIPVKYQGKCRCPATRSG